MSSVDQARETQLKNIQAKTGKSLDEVRSMKGYVSLMRKRQLAMLGLASKGRFEVGLNMKGVEPTDRLTAMPPGGMCQYKVFLTSAAEVDKELLGWIKTAYDGSG